MRTEQDIRNDLACEVRPSSATPPATFCDCHACGFALDHQGDNDDGDPIAYCTDSRCPMLHVDVTQEQAERLDAHFQKRTASPRRVFREIIIEQGGVSA